LLLPETKNSNSRDVPLSTAAVAVLTGLLPKEKGKAMWRKALTVPPELRGPDLAKRLR
jgi:hypothetical protein